MKMLRMMAALLTVALVSYGCASRDRNAGETAKARNVENAVKAQSTSAASAAPSADEAKKAIAQLQAYSLPDPFKPKNQQEADIFGWMMFVNFNWPALPTVRGQRNRFLTIGDPGTVVWETWKTPDEVFYPDGSKPPAWEVYGTKIPPECHSDGAPILRSDILVDRTNQAVGGSLTDQNGNIVHYFISFNKPVFDFVYNNGYYNIAGQNKMNPKNPVNYPAGTAEMKAAWRVLLPTEPDAVKQRFFRRNMYVYTPALGGNPATCQYQEMALVGLHFNYKVTYPDNSTQWIMATFEQVDNVPPFGTPYQPGGYATSHPLPYSLFNKDCYGAKPPCTYNQSTEQGRPVMTPTEVIRTSNIDPAAQQMNPEMQGMLRNAAPNSPWQYYQMVTTQYPANPGGTVPFGQPTPTTSVNTTMETFVRPSSCLGCHGTAQNINKNVSADYSFMLAQACPKPLFPPGVGKRGKTSAVCMPATHKQKH